MNRAPHQPGGLRDTLLQGISGKFFRIDHQRRSRLAAKLLDQQVIDTRRKLPVNHPQRFAARICGYPLQFAILTTITPGSVAGPARFRSVADCCTLHQAGIHDKLVVHAERPEAGEKVDRKW